MSELLLEYFFTFVMITGSANMLPEALMKNVGTIMLGIIITACALLPLSAETKPTFEYGGTQLFTESTNYEDGYDLQGGSLQKYNTRSWMPRTCVTGYVNFSENSRLRLSLDSYGFDKHSNGFYKTSWVFFSFLYWELKDVLGAGSSMKVGLFGTPWPNWEDKVWNYRVISSSLLSSQGITNPQDRGIGFEGNVFEGLEYAVAFVGGQGIYDVDKDNIINTEARLTYALTKEVKLSVGGGSGSRAVDYGVPDYYSYTARYGVGNIHYKSKTYVLSYTVANTDRFDSDFMVDGRTYKSYGETTGKASSVATVWNFFDNFDLIGRQDTLDPDIAAEDDSLIRSFAGFGYRSGEFLKAALTQQCDRNAASNTAYHKIVGNMELRF